MRNALIATAAGLCLFTAACSSSTTGTGSGGSGSDGTGSTAAAGGSSSTAAGLPVGSSSGAAAGGSTTSAAAQGGSGQDANAWCHELEQAGNPAIVGGGNGLSAAGIAKAEQLASDAPDDIRPDVEKLIEADKKMLAGNANADQTQEMLKAGEHVVQWLQSNCPALMNKLNPGLGSALPTG